MSHLGERASDLVDGRLTGAAREKALAHVAACDPCREAVDGERLLKTRLQHLAGPELGADVMAGLLLLGGPEGPLPARPGHVPGSPRPVTVPVGDAFRLRPPAGPPAGRPATRIGMAGPGRLGQMRPRTRVAATALAGTLALAGVAGIGVGVVAAARHEVPTVLPPVASFAAEHAATTQDFPFVGSSGWAGSGR